ncbi:hypothetical protein D9M69_530950 [compost metagenome]
MIGLTAQFIRNHCRLCRQSGNDRDLTTLTLQCFGKRTEIAIARENHKMVDSVSKLHGIDGKFNIHIALHLAATGRVGKFLGCLGDNLVAVVIEPIDKRTDRRVFLILNQSRVIIGAQQITAFLEGLQKFPVINIETECL